MYWVRGLREPRSEFDDWRKVVAELLRVSPGRSATPTASTSASERGYRIPPCWYWYVARTEKLFGHAVIFFRPILSDDIAKVNGGMCPFDSGGLWTGKMACNPPISTEDEKRAFFQAHDSNLSQWPDRCETYLKNNYHDFRDYVLGEPPSNGISGVVIGPPNDAHAWTWEVRISKTAVSGNVEPVSIFWNADDADVFVDWLMDPDALELELELSDRIELVEWLNDNDNVPVALDQTPWTAAQERLLFLLSGPIP